MNRSFSLALCGALILSPLGAAAQVGIAARVGTLGLGAEAAIGLSERIVARGGFGLMSLVASTSFDGIAVDVELPDRWYNAGVDLYLNGAVRVGGGVLFRSDDPLVRGTFDEPVDIGGTTLTPGEIGVLTGRVASRKRAGYALIGFGKHVADGVGLSLDLGAAFMGEPSVSLEAEGGSYDPAQLAALLMQQAADFERDMKTYLRIWPILSLGLRIGFGG